MSIKNQPEPRLDEVLVNGYEPVLLVRASLPAGDIAAQEAAERAPRQSDLRFEALANAVPSIVWIAAPDGTITYASDRWYAYCGLSADQNASNWPEVLHPDDYERCVEAWSRALREGTDYEIEVRNRRYDGEYRWFLTRAVPVRDASGLITAWCGTSTDIHERKRTEEALRAADHRYRGLVEGLGVAVYTTDSSGYITFFNEAAVELWGRRPKLGEDLWCGSWRLYWQDGSPMAHNECPMAVTLKDNRPVRGVDAIAERPDGTRVAFQPYPTPLRDATGNLVGAVNVLIDITDRKQGEAVALRLAAIVDSSDDAIVSKDLDGTITSWNPAAERIFGYTAAEAVGRSIRLIIPPGRQHEEDHVLARVRSGERVDHFETVRRRKDGAGINISLTVSPIRDQAGRVIGASKIARDITERKRADERLALYARIFTNSFEGVAVTDAQGRYIQQNPAHAALLGYSDDELLGKSPTLHMSEDALARMRDALQKAGVFRGEVVSQTKLGESLTLDVSAFPMRDENGEIMSYVGIKRDTTERKMAEERLALYAEIFTNSNEAIAIIDAQARYVEQNAAHAKLLGYTSEELVGKTPAIHLGDEPFQRIAKELQRTGVYQGEVVSHTKQGEELAIDLSAFAMRDENGEITSYVGIKRNITERKRVEALKDQFLSLVSHELRTPIATVLGNALLLLKRGDSLELEDKQRALGDVVSEAEKLQRIIENLLFLTRMEADQDAGFEPVMLGPVVGEAVEAFNRRVPDRHVSAVIEPGVPFVLGRGTLVALVLENLLSNAHKYSPDGAPIEIHVRKNEDGEPEVRVRDHGIGLDELDLQNLFTPFYRSSRAKVHAKGMGLGLAVCKRVIEAQKGKIWARNRPEGGTDFVFTLEPIE